MKPKSFLTLMGGVFMVVAAGGAIQLSGWWRLEAHAETADLLKGCTDVPEAVELAARLNDRALRIQRYLATMDSKKSEIDGARQSLSETLKKLVAEGRILPMQSVVKQDEVDEDVARLVAVYDQMKPEQAAVVISNLPPDFAAEILMRVQPENSAKIMASVDPNQAAVLTSYMGSRRTRH